MTTTTTTSITARRDPLAVLRLDAAASGGARVAATAGRACSTPCSGLPDQPARGVGVLLAVFAAALAALAARPRIPRPAALGGGARQLRVGVASLGLAVGAGCTRRVLGLVVVLAQAGAVAVFADLQYAALRRQT